MMRAFSLVLVFALLGADPSVLPSPAAVDRVPELVGTWSCRDGHRLPGRLWVRSDRDAYIVDLAIQYPERRLSLHERFRPDNQMHGWRVDTEGQSGFSGIGPAWIGDTWTVDGTVNYPNRGNPAERHVRYERPDDRTLRITRWAGDHPATDVVLCLRGDVPPDESTCIAPNTLAITLAAARPESPAIAAEGTVEILVSLDAASNVVGTKILKSDAAVLNVSALDAARRSLYRTAERDCVPIPSQYVFTVSYSR